MDWFEDVFWFTEEILSKILGIEAGRIYNKFNSLEDIRYLKSLFGTEEFLDKLQYYYDNIKK